MAVPKKKHSKGRQGKLSSHNALSPISVTKCPQCSESKLPHRICPSCGYYNGREILPVDSEES